MSNQGPTYPTATVVTANIDWDVSAQMPSRYATLFVAQPLKNEFILSFFEPRLPILVGPPEAVSAQAQQINTVRAECVGRIIVAANQLPELIDVLRTSWDNYQRAQQQALAPTEPQSAVSEA